MIFVRLLEDAVLLGRFAYFYAKAPGEPVNRRVGFVYSGEKMPTRTRVAYAWKRATTL